MAKEADFDEVAAVVDDHGRIQAQFQGLGAQEDAEGTLRVMRRNGIKRYHGASVVTGKDAEKAIKNRRI